jgi:hypothetical protein
MLSKKEKQSLRGKTEKKESLECCCMPPSVHAVPFFVGIMLAHGGHDRGWWVGWS